MILFKLQLTTNQSIFKSQIKFIKKQQLNANLKRDWDLKKKNCFAVNVK